MARPVHPDQEYANYIRRLYGGDQDGDCSELSRPTTVCTSVEVRQERRPVARPLSAAERLSRNRAAKRAATDVTLLNHLSTMYHMNRRIYESHNRSTQAGARAACGGGRSGSGSRPATAAQCAAPPSAVATSRAGSLVSGQRSRPGTAPASGTPYQLRARAAQQCAAAAQSDRPGTAAPLQRPPSYTRRHVQNTAAALKTAILDEICAHRIYEAARLRSLFRSYLSLNSGEAFYPTLAAVVAELRAELGVP